MNAHVKREAGKLTLDTCNYLDSDGADRSNYLAAFQFKSAESLWNVAKNHTWVERNSTGGTVKGENYTLEMARKDFETSTRGNEEGMKTFAY